ncbi:MAG: PQQ-dependent sugar dehydrogenase [Myxococcota bacterium]
MPHPRASRASPRGPRWPAFALGCISALTAPTGCDCLPRPSQAEGTSAACRLVEDGPGPPGTTAVRVEVVARGLRVPWGIAFLSERELLVTERPGRLRLVADGQLVDTPVLEVPGSDTAEGGLLDVVLHPAFEDNRLFYLYRTAEADGAPVNRVEQYRLAEDHRSAARERVILDGIPAATYHNGGRMRFGPDGMLYVGTGDAKDPDRSQDPQDPAGKILRVTADGEIPGDNPEDGSPAFIMGVRNTQGFDWRDDDTLLVSDHGPSGEMMRWGHDEITVARAGDNLGWPDIYGCGAKPGMVSPSIVWEEAVPPGGAAVYRGTAIDAWRGDLMVASLGARHLHRVAFDQDDPRVVERHEVYLRNELGRLREATMGPDGHLYLTTSNCDGRGDCPAEGDAIVRIVPAESE